MLLCQGGPRTLVRSPLNPPRGARLCQAHSPNRSSPPPHPQTPDSLPEPQPGAEKRGPAAPACTEQMADIRLRAIPRSSASLTGNPDGKIAIDETGEEKVTRERLLTPSVWRHSAAAALNLVLLVSPGCSNNWQAGEPLGPLHSLCAELPPWGLCPPLCPHRNSQQAGHPALVCPWGLCHGPEQRGGWGRRASW